MKKILLVMLILFVITATFSVAYAEPVGVTVIADEGWEDATYDPATTVLTNNRGGYSFKLINRRVDADDNTKGTADLTSNILIEAENVVIPSAVVYDGVTYRITRLGTRLLGNPSKNSYVKTLIVSEGIIFLGDNTTGFTNTFIGAEVLTSVTLPSTLEYISDKAFSVCSVLPSIEIPENVTYIGDGVFDQDFLLAQITFKGNKVTTIGKSTNINSNVFSGTIITEIDLPDSLTTLGQRAFGGAAKLTDLVIPAGVTTIYNTTFANMTELKSLTFKGGITSFVGNTIFQGSGKLSTITFEGLTAPNVDTNVGTGVGASGGTMTVYYPSNGIGYGEGSPFRTYFNTARATVTYVPVGPSATNVDITSASITGNVCTVNYQATLSDEDAQLIPVPQAILALYNNDTLISIKRVDSGTHTEQITVNDQVNTAKMFVWTSFANTRPLCHSDKVTVVAIP